MVKATLKKHVEGGLAFIKLNIHFPFSGIPLVDIHPREMKTYVHRNI